jgi:hypothetical protein
MMLAGCQVASTDHASYPCMSTYTMAALSGMIRPSSKQCSILSMMLVPPSSSAMWLTYFVE